MVDLRPLRRRGLRAGAETPPVDLSRLASLCFYFCLLVALAVAGVEAVRRIDARHAARGVDFAAADDAAESLCRQYRCWHF